ncbi:conserved hypothetical protein [mine drainage metagenome]|uniref:Uncharacterized protein n=1 Tax=mine drainage metagenome TaxID=410659 RepID=A0A3P3ZNI5_9ZZZZ
MSELTFQHRNKGVGEKQEQADTHTDHGHSIQQASHDEHLDLQGRNHFRLTSGSFQKTSAQNTEANSGSQCTTANQNGYSDSGAAEQGCEVFHVISLNESTKMTAVNKKVLLN